MPPLNLRKGMHCFFSSTSPRYFWAPFSVRPLMACAHSYVFLKCTRRSTPMALQALLALLGSREYLTIALGLRLRADGSLGSLAEASRLSQ